MKLKIVSIVLMMSMMVSGCGGSNEKAESNSNPSDSPTTSTEDNATQLKKWSKFLKEEIVEFSVSKSDCSYDDGSLELLVKLTNITSREILAIDGSAEVQDVFGEKIMRLNLSSDKSLAAGQTVNVGSWGSSCWGLNNYSSDEARLMEMDNVSESTKVVIEVSKIAFKDGEILEF